MVKTVKLKPVKVGNIDRLHRAYTLLKPIPYRVFKRGTFYQAFEDSIGLLTHGESSGGIEDAVAELKMATLDEFDFWARNKDRYAGYAKLVGRNLEKHITINYPIG